MLPGADNCKDTTRPDPDGPSRPARRTSSTTPSTPRSIEVFALHQGAGAEREGVRARLPADRADLRGRIPTGCYTLAARPHRFRTRRTRRTPCRTATVDTHYLHDIEDKLDDAIQAAATGARLHVRSDLAAPARTTPVCGADSYIFGICSRTARPTARRRRCPASSSRSGRCTPTRGRRLHGRARPSRRSGPPGVRCGGRAEATLAATGPQRAIGSPGSGSRSSGWCCCRYDAGRPRTRRPQVRPTAGTAVGAGVAAKARDGLCS